MRYYLNSTTVEEEMASDGKKPTSVELTAEQQKAMRAKTLSKEMTSMMVAEAKWAANPTRYDKLPAHEKPFPIEPFPHDRQRLPFKMSDEDRLRRKAWVHSQQLTDREPMYSAELERQIYNPFRRLYRSPTNKLFNMLAPIVGEHRVPFFRYTVPKVFFLYLTGCFAWYQIKYNKVNWEDGSGISAILTRPVILPGEEKPPVKEKHDYADRQFSARTTFKGPDYAY